MLIEQNNIIEKRHYKRTRFSEPVRFQFKEESSFGGCLACDIGEGGMKVNFNDFIPLNTEMILQMKLTNTPRVIDVTGQVAWLEKVPYSDRYHVGVRFTKIDSQMQEGIRRYIQSRHS